MLDACGRSIDYLRISITDRCNLRCVYCMPEDGVHLPFGTRTCLPMRRSCALSAMQRRWACSNVRVTGGEPMARTGCLDLVDMLHHIPGIETIAHDHQRSFCWTASIAEAKAKGLTCAEHLPWTALDAEIFRTHDPGRRTCTRCFASIDEALAAGLKVKINAVPVRGMNDAGLTQVAAVGADAAHLRALH